MNALDPWRQALRPLIPKGFLRRDQGDGLFVSDYPRHGEEAPVSNALLEAGYAVETRGGLAYMDGGPEKYRALAAELADMEPTLAEEHFWLRSLAAHLQKTGAEIMPKNLHLLRLTLTTLDEDDLPGLERLLPPAVAEAQRKHISPPKAAGQMILAVLNEIDRKRSGSSC